ncbi:hypothetical protein ACF0H5_023503 [Mactra antiquata]
MFSSLHGFNDVSKKFKTACCTDDWVDRMSHRTTALLLVILGVIVTTAQYGGGTTIKCWIPAQLGKDWHEAYTNHYCWISNTYRIPMLETIPTEVDDRQDAEITYYQWVPLILALQALLFHTPNFIWNFLNYHSGLNLRKVRDLADETQSKNPKERQDAIEAIANVIHKWIKVSKPYKTNRVHQAKSKVAQVFCFYCSKRQGTFITGLYLVTKMLYLVNVIGQFYLLNAFMGTGFNLYGYEYIHALSTGALIKESPRFPRITLCDFEIRQLQNVQRWTVQCVLPINLFNEKVFLFMWFWFVFIAFISCCSFIKWMYKVMFKSYAYSFVKKYLILTDPNLELSSADKKLLRRFAEQYLRKDGCYVTWMIGHNSTDLVVIDLIQKLWSDYKESFKPRTQPDMNSHFANSQNDMKLH